MLSRMWKQEDQEIFARISGDFNPMHMDAVESRKFVFGKSVVHGIHLVLWALEEYFLNKANPVSLKSLHVVFQKPVGIEEFCELAFLTETDNSIKMRITSQGSVCADISLEFLPSMQGISHSLRIQTTFNKKEPNVIDSKNVLGLSGRMEIAGDFNILERRFPSVCKVLPAQQLFFILTTTRLVGMQCPGLYSIYSELKCQFEQTVSDVDSLEYTVLDHNSMFNLLRINLKSSIAHGEIKSFIRPSLPQRDLIAEIRAKVNVEEFKGQKALIIGGSRGLGAIATKALALGGAEVVVTYLHGKKEAEDIQQALTPFQLSFRTCHFDASADQDILEVLPAQWNPTHLYYFATPFIFDGVKKKFSTKLYSRFTYVYVYGFWRIFERLVSRNTLKFVLYPSSSALNEMPGNMFEYTAAKAAGESICAYINKYFPGITVSYPRLERLATEQTLSLVPVKNRDPLDVVMGILKRTAMESKEDVSSKIN